MWWNEYTESIIYQGFFFKDLFSVHTYLYEGTISGWPQLSSQSPSTLFFEIVSLTEPWWEWLATEPHQSTCLCHSALGVQAHVLPLFIFMWALGIEPRSPCLHGRHCPDWVISAAPGLCFSAGLGCGQSIFLPIFSSRLSFSLFC